LFNNTQLNVEGNKNLVVFVTSFCSAGLVVLSCWVLYSINKMTHQQKVVERLIRGKRGLCPYCFHDKARSTIIGTFCMSCKKDINKENEQLQIFQ